MSILGSTLRGWAKAYAIALGLAVTLTVSGLVGVNVMIDNKIAGIERVDVDVEPNTNPAEPANFLLIGSDTREFVESEEEEEAFGDAEEVGGERSDTIMIVHVDPEAQTGLLVSFPRDLLVEIPGLGEEKINAAFNTGGPDLIIQTIQENFDIPIHHYLEIDFASFQGIVDAVGGVPIYLEAPARDLQTGFEITGYFNFQPGCYELDGRLALGYVRSREFELYLDGSWDTDPRGDIGRIDRQQAFMRRLAAEAVATALANPLKANSISDEALAQLTADQGLGRDDINKLIQAFRNVDPNDPNSIQMLTVPYLEAGDGANLELDEAAAEPLFAQLRQFTPPEVAPDGPAPSSIRIRVFNGSGENGAAAATLEALEDEGFSGVGTGNNPDGTIEATEVRYRPGSEDKAQVVLDYLGGAGTLVEDDSIVEADVLLVIGEEFDGLTPPVDAGADPTATTAAPAPTESSVDEGTESEQEPTPGAEPTAPETQC